MVDDIPVQAPLDPVDRAMARGDRINGKKCDKFLEEFDKVWKNRNLKAMDGNADNYRELGEIYDQFEHRFNSQDGSKNMHVERQLYQLANILLMYGS